MREVKIRPALNGWVVDVGCQTLVYTGVVTLLCDLREYMHEGRSKEKRFIATAINKDLMDALKGPQTGCYSGTVGVGGDCQTTEPIPTLL